MSALDFIYLLLLFADFFVHLLRQENPFFFFAVISHSCGDKLLSTSVPPRPPKNKQQQQQQLILQGGEGLVVVVVLSRCNTEACLFVDAKEERESGRWRDASGAFCSAQMHRH